MVAFPIANRKYVNIVAFVTIPGGEGKILEGPPMQDVTKQEMIDQYPNWEPDVITLLEVRVILAFCRNCETIG